MKEENNNVVSGVFPCGHDKNTHYTRWKTDIQHQKSFDDCLQND